MHLLSCKYENVHRNVNHKMVFICQERSKTELRPQGRGHEYGPSRCPSHPCLAPAPSSPATACLYTLCLLCYSEDGKLNYLLAYNKAISEELSKPGHL